MSVKKKLKYNNYIIFTNGASIKKKSLKNRKIFELFKDNYNSLYIDSLKNKETTNTSIQTSTIKFLKKFKNN